MSRTLSKTSGDLPNYEVNLAIVSDDILPNQVGRVSFQASWWPALCLQNIHIRSGTVVKVMGRDNITLLVEPLLVEPLLVEPPLVEPLVDRPKH